MEAELSRTRAIVASLRGLLTPRRPTWRCSAGPCPTSPAVSVTARVAAGRHRRTGARRPSRRCTQRLHSPPTGPGGALYGEEFFTEAVGEVTAFVPVEGGPRPPHPRRRLRRRGARRPVRRLRQDLRRPRLARRRPRDGGARADPGDLPGQPTRHHRRGQLPHRGVLADQPPEPEGEPLRPMSTATLSLGQIVIDAGDAAGHRRILVPAARPSAGRRRQPVLRRRPAGRRTAACRP